MLHLIILSFKSIQANIPDGFIVDHINGLVDEGGGVVVAVSLVEDGQSELVLLGVEEVVNAEDVEEVHLVTRVQGAVEVTLGELQSYKYEHKLKSTFWW